MKMLLTLFFVFFLLPNTFASQPTASPCKRAHIKSFLIAEKYSGVPFRDLCLAPESRIPAKALGIINDLAVLNSKIAKVLNLDHLDPFGGGLTIEVRVSDMGPIQSEYDKEQHRVVLGARAQDIYAAFPSSVYVHELGHWYISVMLPLLWPEAGQLQNQSTFQEFFSDALTLSVTGKFDLSLPNIPSCLTDIRDIGEMATFRRSIGHFDSGHFFRKNRLCCSEIAKNGQHDESTISICNSAKEMEKFYFPKGVPPGLSGPLNQNILALHTQTEDAQTVRIDSHLSSAPMTSFVWDLSKRLNIPIMRLILPALNRSIRTQTEYSCNAQEILNQGFDLGTSYQTSAISLENFFENMRSTLPHQEQRDVFANLYLKYSIGTGREILKNDIAAMKQFLAQVKVREKIKEAWQKGNPFLRGWSCLNQSDGSALPDCELKINCRFKNLNPLDNILLMRRDQQNTLHTPIIHLVNKKKEQTVIFYGLNHTAPKHYYESVFKEIERDATQASRNSIVLREFFACSDQEQNLDFQRRPITQDQVRYLNAFDQLFYPAYFTAATKESLKPLFEVYDFAPSSCKLDVDGRTLRPSLLVDRNATSCGSLRSKEMSCQWTTLEKKLTESRSIETKNGDLILGREPAGVQIAALNMYRGLPVGNLDQKESLELWTRLLVPSNYVLFEHREQRLVKLVLQEFKQGRKVVVLPWGVSHVTGLKNKLMAEGFYQTKIREVPFAHQGDRGLDPDVDSMLANDLDYIGKEYHF